MRSWPIISQVQAESLPRGGRLRAAAHRRRGPAGGCEGRAGACVRALTADGVLERAG